MKPVLLIVDDAKTIHLVMNEMFENDFELLHATNLSEARMNLCESKVDLIILDVNLKEENGFEFCKEIRSEGNTETPIIFITASNKKEDVIRAFEVGGNDFVEKPFERTVVKRRIQTLLDLKLLEGMKNQKKKEESALSMLATLSHDIINPLTLIKKEILTLRKRNESELDGAISGIENAVSRISTALEKAKSVDVNKMTEYSEGIDMFEVDENE